MGTGSSVNICGTLFLAFQTKALELEQSLHEVNERYQQEKQKRKVLHNSLVVSIQQIKSIMCIFLKVNKSYQTVVLFLLFSSFTSAKENAIVAVSAYFFLVFSSACSQLLWPKWNNGRAEEAVAESFLQL